MTRTKCRKYIFGAIAALLIVSCGKPPTGEQTRGSISVSELVRTGAIEELQVALAENQVSCVEIVSAYLARIEAFDKSKGLNAITVVNPEALADAAAMDARYASGETIGSLFCAPILVKDNIDTAGLATTGGSLAFSDIPPRTNAPIMQRLLEADAILIAKTNMAEWAFSPRQSISATYGRTINAYDTGLTPAGSSGGTASGVAAGFGVAGLGTDTGNSVRGPSSHLALTGLRPTLGLVSRTGIVPLAFDRDTAGPMAQSARDAALLMDVLAGVDPEDSYTDRADQIATGTFQAAIESASLSGVKIGVLRALADPESTDPEILESFETAISDLGEAGADIVDPFVIPNLDTHLDNGSMFCPRFRYDVAQYAQRRGEALDTNEVLASGAYGTDDPRVKGGLEYFSQYPIDVHPKDWETPCPDLLDHPGRMAYRGDVIAALDDGEIDLFIYPSWTSKPAAIDRANEDYRGDNSQLVAPATGLPAATTPMGFTNDGAPLGLQISGRPYSDPFILGVAAAYEAATQHRRLPDGYPALSDE